MNSARHAHGLALTADLGNSRLKLCVWSSGRRVVVERAAFDVALGVGELAADFARARGPFAAIALSSVASAARELEVADALRGIGGRFELAPDTGLDVDVREPARVGRDRLYAARGALAVDAARAVVGTPAADTTRDTSFVIVDAGTALTVDALVGNRFLGGAIAPGPTLLARALAEYTARLPLVEPSDGAHALGKDTEAAVRAGVVVGFRGAARELALRVANEAGLTRPTVVVTGGARALLLSPNVFADAPFARCIEDEDLVHRGLLAALEPLLRR